jgi:hypothetical protein
MMPLAAPAPVAEERLRFLGLLFGHAWSDPVKLGQALAAFAAFCLLASAVYVMNDLIDREQDRLHPKKKEPAAGRRYGEARPRPRRWPRLPGRRRRDRLVLGRARRPGSSSPTCCSMSATASASSMW